MSGDMFLRSVLMRKTVASASPGIAWVGGDASANNSASTITLALPAHQAGDFAIVWGLQDGLDQTFSIGTATGWTKLTQIRETSGRAMELAIFYKELTSSAEDDPVFTSTATDQIGASVLVFRNVDTSNPFDVTYSEGSHYVAENDQVQPTPQPITTATAGAAVVLLSAYSLADLVTPGAPAGYDLGPDNISDDIAHADIVTAYLLNAGAAGVKAPGAFTNIDDTSVVTDSRCVTLALRKAA